MQTIVIFGGNLGIVPLILNLRRRGLRVLALGHDPNQLGAKVADAFEVIDYRSLNSIERALHGQRVAGFVPGAHDLHYRAYSDYMDAQCDDGQNRLSAYEALHNKRIFRERLRKVAPARCPAFLCQNEFNTLSVASDFFPALFKPEHAGGGRGIIAIETFDEFSSLLSQTQLVNGIIERCVSGVDISVSLWLKDGKCCASYSDREVSGEQKFRITGSITSNTLFDYLEKYQIISELANIASEMGIQDGFVHCQIRLSTPTTWKIIEFTSRLPGDVYPLVPEFFSCLNYSTHYLSEFIPQFVPRVDFSSQKLITECAVGRVCLFKGMKLPSELVNTLTLPSHSSVSADAYNVSLYLSQGQMDIEKILDPNLILSIPQ